MSRDSRLSLLLMPFRSSSTPRAPRNKSSLPIDDDIYQRNPNVYVLSLRFMKEREDPEHEFLILRTDYDDFYRIERRPSKGSTINSKLLGCKAEDTVTHLNGRECTRVSRVTSCRLNLHFCGEPKPDLHTVFDYCNAIRKDPDSKKYTLAQFNCYFFARTLTVLITRHILLRRLCCRIHKSPKNDFGSLPGPEIDAILDEVMDKMLPRGHWLTVILFDFTIEGDTYQDLRRSILKMDKRHCKRVTQFGGKGDVVYDNLEKKKEEIWRRMHSDLKPPERMVDIDLGLDPQATAQSDEDIKEFLLTRAERSNDTSLSHLVRAL